MYNKLEEKIGVFIVKKICTKINSCFVVQNEVSYLEFEKLMEVMDRYLKTIKMVVYIFLVILNISVLIVLKIFVSEVFVAFFAGAFSQITLMFLFEKKRHFLFKIQETIMIIYEIDSVKLCRNDEN